MNLLSRVFAVILTVVGVMGLLGTVIGKDPARSVVALSIFFALMVGAGVLLFRNALRAGKRAEEKAEVHKLLVLAGEHGTLAPPQLIAAGYSKEEAADALKLLKQSGLAEFDVDDTGTPVYRLHKSALEARKRKGW